MQEESIETYRPRGYWAVENRQYAEPSFRLRKCARVFNRLASGSHYSLLDVGCGPGALRRLLDPNIDYHGIDIAIQEAAPFLREMDFARNPIDYGGQQFDFVAAMGVFEYMGSCQKEKFLEIRKLIKPKGTFMLSYINFEHRRHLVWPNYNNVQSIAAIKESLVEFFRIEQCFPASHHWRQKQPGKNSLRPLQMHINFNIPIFSPLFAVEYFFICSPLGEGISSQTTESSTHDAHTAGMALR